MPEQENVDYSEVHENGNIFVVNRKQKDYVKLLCGSSSPESDIILRNSRQRTIISADCGSSEEELG